MADGVGVGAGDGFGVGDGLGVGVGDRDGGCVGAGDGGLVRLPPGDGVGRGPGPGGLVAGRPASDGPGVATRVSGGREPGCGPADALDTTPAATAPATITAAAPPQATRRWRRRSPRRMTSAGASGAAVSAASSAIRRSSSPSSGTGHFPSAAAPCGEASLRCGARAARPRASRALTVPDGTPVSAAICATLWSHT